MAYVLRETLASERQERNIWFRFCTVIGPCCTSDEKERALFRSLDEAKNSAAMMYPLSFFEVIDVGAGAGDLDWNLS